MVARWATGASGEVHFNHLITKSVFSRKLAPVVDPLPVSTGFSWGARIRYPARPRGEVAEWSNAAVLKTVDPQGSGGSNPSLSANLFNENN